MLKAIRISRGDRVDVSINDPSVSRLHAELVVCESNRFYLSDCGSTGGTFVGRDGGWVPIKQEYVEAGESILLGHFPTTASQLVALAGEAGESGPKDGSGKGGRKPIPQDALPEGPVKRDPETGDIISIKD